MEFFVALPAIVVVMCSLGLFRFVRSDGFHSVPPPPGSAAWTAGSLPSVPYAGAFRDSGA